MKQFSRLSILAIVVLLYSCTKNTDGINPSTYLPTVSTTVVTAVTNSTAVVGGNIINIGGSSVTASGVVYGTGTGAQTTTVNGSNSGSFTINLSSLTPNKLYYIQAYATNNSGTTYGNTVSFITEVATPGVPGENDPIFLGNPTNAQASYSFPENYLKDNIYYKLAYSRSRSTSTWVAWHQQSEDLGSASRQDDYRADVNLPVGWYQVQNTSFSGSGFDRGHNCPSGDRTSSIAANSSTFLMTNMIPQSQSLNQGPWGGLEDFVRNSLLGTTNEAYIFMGNYGQGGYNATGTLVNTVDEGKINVPSNIWKVVLIIPKGTNDISRITSSAVVLTVDMPNDNRLYTGGGSTLWRNYLTTVSNLEIRANAMGIPLNLFQNIDATVRTALKAKIYP